MPRIGYYNFEIRDISSAFDGHGVIIEIKGLESLPFALRRLAEMGHDMAPSLKALQEAVEQQSKRKALDAAINDLAKKD